MGNVLVIGNSGVGKSTLINSVLGENAARTGWGTSGTTNKLEIYESEQIGFRIIDSIGFEPSFIKEHQAINAIKKWSKESAKEGGSEKQINVIWFCVDGTSSKLFPQTIKNLSRATSMWESVPVIVVITKSYSEPERERNIEMVNNAFAQQKKYGKNLRKVIPVVAESYALNSTAVAPPVNITELIDATNEVMPEGLKAGTEDINAFIMKRKRLLAQGLVGTFVAAGAAVGATPFPFADAAILTPMEVAEINAIASIYGVNKGEEAKRLINSMVEVGTVSTAARAVISGLKAIPAINAAADVLNAVIAGVFVAAIGEGSVLVFEQISSGKRSSEDIDWVKKIMESQLSGTIISSINDAVEDGKLTRKMSPKEIAQLVFRIISGLRKKEPEEIKALTDKSEPDMNTEAQE